jgi:putative nucleotidyltransferase with HDIG domain
MKVIIVMTVYPTRPLALALLQQYTQNEFLLKHALAVEAVLRHFAGLFGENAEKWGIIGLVHDLDYEKYPEEHCTKVREILKEQNWPEEYIRAIASHGWQICSDVEPKERMEKVLYAIDELTGLITAVVLVRPDKNLFNLEVKSVKKKWKEKSFAAGVNREIIAAGAAMLEMELGALMTETIHGMQNVAGDLGLDGKK